MAVMSDEGTDQPMMQRVSVTERGPGQAEIHIDGVDQTSNLMGLTIDMAAREMTQIVLTLAHPVVEFDGYARIAIGVPQDPGPAAAHFLSAIDAEELEQTALNRLDLGTGRHALTEAMLRQLQDWAHGRS